RLWFVFFFSSRRRHTRSKRDWSSDVCSSDLSPWGEGAPVRTLGRMRGRFRTQPFLVESLRGSRQSPQRNFSPAPLGKSIAPSSVTFGDSFPPRGSLWV